MRTWREPLTKYCSLPSQRNSTKVMTLCISILYGPLIKLFILVTLRALYTRSPFSPPVDHSVPSKCLNVCTCQWVITTRGSIIITVNSTTGIYIKKCVHVQLSAIGQNKLENISVSAKIRCCASLVETEQTEYWLNIHQVAVNTPPNVSLCLLGV